MKNYLNLMFDALYEGTKKPTRAKINGEHVSAFSLFGRTLRFDLAEGFPLVTTRRISWVTAAHELIWMLSGDTNIRYLQQNGVTIWNKWADEQGNLGPVYGKSLRAWGDFTEDLVEIDPIVDCDARYDIEYKTPPPPALSGDERIIGGNDGSRFAVIGETKGADGHRMLKLVSTKTGYAYEAHASSANKGGVRDRMIPSIGVVGKLGPIKIMHSDEVHKNLIRVWVHMIERCYDTSCKEYPFYGGKGVRVCKRWHTQTAFLEDARKIPAWYHKRTNPTGYELDKDYFGSNVYAPDTTIWLKSSHNVAYANSEPVRGYTPGGRTVLAISAERMSKRTGINRKRIRECVLGKRDSHQGYRFEKYQGPKLLRMRAPIDQVDNLLADIAAVKADPCAAPGRRLILNMWNVGELKDMALPPCPMMAQFNVTDGKLSCMVTQRSADLFIGLPYDIAVYAMLTCMVTQRSADLFIGLPYDIAVYAMLTHVIAHITGLTVGDLVFSIGDAHIYENHVDAVAKQLQRTPRQPPRLRVYNLGHLDDLELANLYVDGYTHDEALTAEVAV